MKEEITQSSGGVTKSHKINSTSRLQQRIAAAKKEEQEKIPKKHRLVVMPDLSGSMDTKITATKRRFDYLQDALKNFVLAINEQDTSITLVPFPSGKYIFGPCSQKHLLLSHIQSLKTDGHTPMGSSMEEAISSFSMTRALIISDGVQTDGDICFDVLPKYIEIGVSIDCIYIGLDKHGGEETLKRIAATTKGLYIKFDNLGNFTSRFSYLAPAYRGLLNSSNAAEHLGAKEVK